MNQYAVSTTPLNKTSMIPAMNLHPILREVIQIAVMMGLRDLRILAVELVDMDMGMIMGRAREMERERVEKGVRMRMRRSRSRRVVVERRLDLGS